MRLKIVALIVALATVPALITALTLYFYGSGIVEELSIASFSQELNELAANADQTLESQIRAAVTIGYFIEHNLSTDGNQIVFSGEHRSAIERFATRVTRSRPDIISIRVLSGGGQEILRFDGQEEGQVLYRDNVKRLLKVPEYTDSVLTLHSGEVYVSAPQLDPNADIGEYPYIVLATPLRPGKWEAPAVTGTSVGVVEVRYSMESFFQRLLSTSLGGIEIFDQDGNRLRSDRTPTARQSRAAFEKRGVSQNLFVDRPEIREYVDLESRDQGYSRTGDEFLFWKRIDHVKSDLNKYWALFAFVPKEVLTGSIAELHWLFWGMEFAIVGIILVVGFLVANAVATPLENLVEGTKRLGRGDLAYRVPVHVGLREYRNLAESINAMAESLEETLTRRDQLELEIEGHLHTKDRLERLQVAMLNLLEDAKRREQELVRSEGRFHLAVNASPNGIVMVNARGEIVLVNEETERLFGYDRSELLGQAVEILLPDRFKRIHPELVQQFYRHPEKRAMGAGRNLVGMRKDGSEFPVEVGLNPIETDEGRFVLSSVVDTAEREMILNQLTYQKDEMEQLLYTVSHDLKSPLVTIQGFMGMLQESLKEGDLDDVADCARRIENATESMEKLIRDLLELNRVGRKPAEWEQVEVEKVVREVRHTLQADFDKVAAVLTIETELPVISADAGQLYHIYSNLVSNALKYGCDCPGDEIGVGCIESASYYKFYVRDGGPGVPSQYREKIFLLFQRLESRHEGSGLGLAIVMKSARMLGGTAWVESHKGEGATFWFSVAKDRDLSKREIKQGGALNVSRGSNKGVETYGE